MEEMDMESSWKKEKYEVNRKAGISSDPYSYMENTGLLATFKNWAIKTCDSEYKKSLKDLEKKQAEEKETFSKKRGKERRERAINQLQNFFHTFPRSVTKLNLSNTGLGDYTGEELKESFCHLPPKTSSLNLCGNDLNSKTGTELVALINIRLSRIEEVISDEGDKLSIILQNIKALVVEGFKKKTPLPTVLINLIMNYLPVTTSRTPENGIKKPAMLEEPIESLMKQVVLTIWEPPKPELSAAGQALLTEPTEEDEKTAAPKFKNGS